MIRIQRTEAHEGPREVAGRTITLVSRTWTVIVATRRFGAGWTYRKPLYINDRERGNLPLRDHVMLARIAAAIIFVATIAARRNSP